MCNMYNYNLVSVCNYNYMNGRIKDCCVELSCLSQLAVLGACQCGQSDDPCSCAESAANLKRDFRKLKDSVSR